MSLQRSSEAHDGHIGVLQERMHAQDCVVRLDDGGSHLRAAPHGEGDLALLAIIHGQPCELTRSSAYPLAWARNFKTVKMESTPFRHSPRRPLQHEAAKAGSCSAAACVVDAEALESCASDGEIVQNDSDDGTNRRTKEADLASRSQLSASFLMRSKTRSTISFPMV